MNLSDFVIDQCGFLDLRLYRRIFATKKWKKKIHDDDGEELDEKKNRKRWITVRIYNNTRAKQGNMRWVLIRIFIFSLDFPSRIVDSKPGDDDIIEVFPEELFSNKEKNLLSEDYQTASVRDVIFMWQTFECSHAKHAETNCTLRWWILRSWWSYVVVLTKWNYVDIHYMFISVYIIKILII